MLWWEVGEGRDSPFVDFDGEGWESMVGDMDVMDEMELGAD
jgi:hypothetical protein